MSEEDKLRPFGVAKFMGKEDDNKQRKIIPDKSGGGKHRVEDDKTSEATKPVPDPDSDPRKPKQN